jgi:hypothetical protein
MSPPLASVQVLSALRRAKCVRRDEPQMCNRCTNVPGRFSDAHMALERPPASMDFSQQPATMSPMGAGNARLGLPVKLAVDPLRRHTTLRPSSQAWISSSLQRRRRPTRIVRGKSHLGSWRYRQMLISEHWSRSQSCCRVRCLYGCPVVPCFMMCASESSAHIC